MSRKIDIDHSKMPSKEFIHRIEHLGRSGIAGEEKQGRAGAFECVVYVVVVKPKVGHCILS